MKTNIKTLRYDNNISQFILSKETGFVKSAICCWEKGTRIPSAKAIIILSRYFQVSTDYLLCQSNDKSVIHNSYSLDVDLSIFSQRLKELRKKSNLSLISLSASVNISKSALSAWENNISVPNAQAVVTLAKFFGVTTDFLLGDTY